MGRITLLHAGGSAAANTTPLLIGGGFLDPTSVSNPRINTFLDAPVGSVIVAVTATFDSLGACSVFHDGVNTYSNQGSNFTWYGTGIVNTWSTEPISALLPSGTPVGPNTTGNTKLYMVVFAFPGAVSKDPEAGAMTTTFPANSGNAVVNVSAIAGADVPQYIAFFVGATSQGTSGLSASGFIDLAGSVGMNGGFGIRGWYRKVTAPNASNTVCTGTFATGGDGVAAAAMQRTVKVVS